MDVVVGVVLDAANLWHDSWLVRALRRKRSREWNVHYGHACELVESFLSSLWWFAYETEEIGADPGGGAHQNLNAGVLVVSYITACGRLITFGERRGCSAVEKSVYRVMQRRSVSRC
ncbi:unannotated protein [freshwater metagenome]|uniref:Unannotated protein n=1 Tax=freshwater metagenome TaxID=449393 RepID=A0A6J6IHN7_9ZZZZ